MSKITVNHSFNMLHILTIVFVILKLCDIIDWRWIMVLLPSIIDIALCLIALIIFKTIVLIESIGLPHKEYEKNLYNYYV